jgi:hypothetical protein
VNELIERTEEALVAAGITGPHRSHSRRNVISKIHSIVEGGTDDRFGLGGLDHYSPQEVLDQLAALTGCSNDLWATHEFDTIDPARTIEGIIAAARRLLESAGRGDRLLVATGHPTGLLEHHIHVVEAYRRAGGKVVHLREDENISERKGKHLEVRYVGGVGCAADWGQLLHTHSAFAMEQLLDAGPAPDIVFADHGFAGAALERGISTIAVIDINDPALAVAVVEGRDLIGVPMDDNRLPRSYEPSWSLFEMILSGRDPRSSP